MINDLMLDEPIKITEKPILSPKNFDWVEDEVVAIIFETKGHDVDLCGKTMTQWVKLACVRIPTIVMPLPRDEDFASSVCQAAEGKKIALVLYSDTPLLKQDTVLKVLDEFSSLGMNALSLLRGYVFKVDYLNSAKEIFSPARRSIAPEQFQQVETAEQIGEAAEIIWQRIRDFHKQNGVILKGEKTIFIDADVQIESGVVIEPMNIITGSSVIEENVLIKSGNYIENSVIKSGAILQGKRIVNGEEI